MSRVLNDIYFSITSTIGLDFALTFDWIHMMVINSTFNHLQFWSGEIGAIFNLDMVYYTSYDTNCLMADQSTNWDAYIDTLLTKK